MKNKSIYLLLFILTFLLNENLFAIGNEKYEEIIEETLEIIHSNPSELINDKLEINYKLIKEKVQNDLKIGKVDTHLNEYLFIHGVIYNDIISLQSFLLNRDIKDIESRITKYLNLSIIKKLALAAQENRMSQKTKVYVSKNTNCFYFINGHNIDFEKYFIVPAGVPFYFAVECNTHSYEIKKVVTAETQQEIKIEFKNLQNKVEMPTGVPNPFQASRDYDEDDDLEDKNNSNFRYRLGIGFINDYTILKDRKISNLEMPTGKFMNYNFALLYNNYIFSASYARVHLEIKKSFEFYDSYSNSHSEKQVLLRIPANYYEIALGRVLQLYQFNDTVVIDNLFAVTAVILQSNFSAANMNAFGIKYQVGPTIKLNELFLLDINVGVSKFFGQIDGFQVSTNFGVLFQFFN